MIPLNAYLDVILETTQRSKYTIIRAPTGSGKSTCVPLYLLTYWNRVLLTTPRRSAAEALYRYFLLSRQDIGLIMRGIHIVSADTRLIVATEGAAMHLNMEPNILIFDEVHEFTDELEMLLVSVCEEETHCVLMSATVAVEGLMSYLGNEECAIIDALVRQPFKVEVRFSTSTSTDYLSNYLDVVREIIPQALELGETLVFLPGKREISRLSEEFDYIEPVSFHSESHSLSAAMSPDTRLILATDAAETSLTLPFVKCVVDSGLKKYECFIDGVRGLKLSYITSFSQIQRKGRIGRICDGFYFPAFNDEAMEIIKNNNSFSEPDAFKFAMFLAERHRFTSIFVHPCQLSALEQEINKMMYFGWFEVPERGILTPEAKSMLSISFVGSVERIMLIFSAMREGCGAGELAIAAVALLSYRDEIDFTKMSKYLNEYSQQNDFLVLARYARQQYLRNKDAELCAVIEQICSQIHISFDVHTSHAIAEQSFLTAVRVAYAQETAKFGLNWSIAGKAARIGPRSTLWDKFKGDRVFYEHLFTNDSVLEMQCLMPVDI